MYKSLDVNYSIKSLTGSLSVITSYKLIYNFNSVHIKCDRQNTQKIRNNENNINMEDKLM